MAGEGKLTTIPFEQIPPSAQYNENGDKAYFAVAMGYKMLRKFEELIPDLRT